MHNIEKFEGIMSDTLRVVFFVINIGIQLGLAFFLSLVAMYIFHNGGKLKKNDQTIFVVVFVILSAIIIRILPNPVNHLLPSSNNYEQFENGDSEHYHGEHHESNHDENEFVEDNSNATLVSPELNIPLSPTDNELSDIHEVRELIHQEESNAHKEKSKAKKASGNGSGKNIANDGKGNIYVTYNTKNEIEINELERKKTDSKEKGKEHQSPVMKEMNQRLKDLEQLYRMSQYDGIQGPLSPKEHHTTLPLTTEDNIISRRIRQHTGPDIYNTDGYTYLKNNIWGVPTQRPPICIGKPVKYPSAYQGEGLTKYGSI